MLPWQKISFTLSSPHSPEECAARVKTVTADPHSGFGLVALWSSKPLVGYADATYLCLRKLHFSNNPFRPELTATLAPTATGTQLVCEIRLNWSARIFLTVACSFLTLVGCCIVADSFRRTSAGLPFLEGIVGLLGFLAFAGAIGTLGMRSTASEHQFLERTLAERLEAHKAR